MKSLLKDVHCGLRSLLKTPGFAAGVLLTLALGIGPTIAIFSVVHGVLLRPLPYAKPDGLVRIWEKAPQRGIERGPVSFPNLSDWRQRNQAFEAIAAYMPNFYNLSGKGEPRQVIGAAVSAELFSVLGVEPTRGRGPMPQEDRPGGNRVAVLSNRLWRSAFGSDPKLVGGTLHIEGEPRTVVGIMPPGFHFPDRRFDLWVPLALDPASTKRSHHNLQTIARLREGGSLDQARDELSAIASHLAEAYPDTNKNRSVLLLPLYEEIVGPVRPLLLSLFMAVFFVLLIACANVGNLMLGRASARQGEMGLRLALGAGGGRLFRQALIESLLLTLPGSAAGLLMAYGAIALLKGLGPRLPRLQQVGLDFQVLAFAAAISIVAGLIFALIPTLRCTSARQIQLLQAGGRSPCRASHSPRALLVVSQVALALVLLVGAGLMTRSFLHLGAVETGFRSDHLLTLEIPLPQTLYQESREIAAFYGRVLEQVKGLPGVETAGLISHLPLSGSWATRSFLPERGDAAASQGRPQADYRLVSPEYFEAMGIPLMRGLPLGSDAAAQEVVVNQSMARRFWAGRDAVGERLSFSGSEGPWLTIAGVVGDIRHYSLQSQPRPEIYQSYEQMPWPWPQMSLVVRTVNPPMELADTIRDRVWSVDPEVPVTQVASLEQLKFNDMGEARFNMLLMELFAALALLLAAIGIYGMMSYSVSRRTMEMGIRMALGAQRKEILQLVLGQGLLVTLLGIAIGVAAALGLARFLSSLLFGVSATDSIAFAAAVLLLAAVSILACCLPAWRATRVEPLATLRHL